MKYTEHQLDRLVDQINDDRRDRDLENKRAKRPILTLKRKPQREAPRVFVQPRPNAE